MILLYSWYQNVNKKYVQLNKAHDFFAVTIFQLKYWNVNQIRQKSTPSTQTLKEIKHFIITSTHVHTQAHQARKHAKHVSMQAIKRAKHTSTPSTRFSRLLEVISHILQLPEIEKKKVAVLIGSLQTTVESLLALLEVHGTRRKKLEI